MDSALISRFRLPLVAQLRLMGLPDFSYGTAQAVQDFPTRVGGRIDGITLSVKGSGLNAVILSLNANNRPRRP